MHPGSVPEDSRVNVNLVLDRGQINRILLGAEARLLLSAFGVLVDQLEEVIAGYRESLEFGVPVFDRLQGGQQLALLAEVGHHLFCSTAPPPPLTAVNEAAVAVLYRVIEEWVTMEVDDEDVIRAMPGQDPISWRRELLDAYREACPDDDEIPPVTSHELADWELLIECLEARVLWDADYLDEDLYADQPPDAGQALKERMGVADEYFRAVAPEPTDSELEKVRQTIRTLPDG